MLLAYAVVFVILYVIIYVVPRVSGIFLETYTAEYGTLEVSQESSYMAVRDEKLYVSDNGGAVSRAAAQGRLMRKNSHIVDVGGVKHYSQQKGIVSYYYDGLEGVYTPENMQTITEADLELTDEEKQERRRLYNRMYQADRRAAERALNAFYNKQYARERREALAKGKAEFDQRTVH